MKLIKEYMLKRRMKAKLGYTPNLRNPRTFNEKIAWRMLHDRNALFPLTMDKYAVRDYVTKRVGSDILVPLIAIWKHPQQMLQTSWDWFPRQFAVKATHGWNMNIFVTDKSTANRKEILDQASDWFNHSHYIGTKEWGYKDIPPAVMVEHLLHNPIELKFQVFHGCMRLFRAHKDRYGDHRVTFFDENLQRIPLSQNNLTDPDYELPSNIREFVRIAERLGRDFDYVRVDLYCVDDERIYFNELTHYESSACRPFEPVAYDHMLGDMWTLPGG